MNDGYSYQRTDWKVFITNPHGVAKEFGVNVAASDANVESFMNSLTESQLRDMFKEKK